MKIVSSIENGLCTLTCYRRYFEAVKSFSGADAVVVLMDGDFLHAGYLAPESREARSAKLLDAGADMVVELPAYGALLRQDSYVFAAAMLMQKMGCVNKLALPCRRQSLPLMQTICDFLVHLPMEYQRELLRLRQERTVGDTVPGAVEKFIPGAQTVLCHPGDRFAVEVKSAMVKSYCTTQAGFFPFETELGDVNYGCYDEALGSRICRMVRELPEAYFENIFGGSEELARCLPGLCRQEPGFEELARTLAGDEFRAQSARQYLLRAMMGYSHINHSVFALYSYATCVKILGCRSERLLAKVQASASIPLRTQGAEHEVVSRAEQLCQEIREQCRK